MEYLYVFGGLSAGLLLVSVSVACASLYTPYTKSTFDTLFTAFTGSSLQVGNLLIVSALTATVFDLLVAVAGFEVSLFVPVLVAYTVVHLAAHRASLRVADLMKRPLDPDFSFDALSVGPFPFEATRNALRRARENAERGGKR